MEGSSGPSPSTTATPSTRDPTKAAVALAAGAARAAGRAPASVADSPERRSLKTVAISDTGQNNAPESSKTVPWSEAPLLQLDVLEIEGFHCFRIDSQPYWLGIVGTLTSLLVEDNNKVLVAQSWWGTSRIWRGAVDTLIIRYSPPLAMPRTKHQLSKLVRFNTPVSDGKEERFLVEIIWSGHGLPEKKIHMTPNGIASWTSLILSLARRCFQPEARLDENYGRPSLPIFRRRVDC